MKFPAFSLLNREFAAETGSPQTACTTTHLRPRRAPDLGAQMRLGFRPQGVATSGDAAMRVLRAQYRERSPSTAIGYQNHQSGSLGYAI
jgi:hypothetical protein